jgi:hypothetical protein
MSNTTRIGARQIHGTDPQNLIPSITRNKIHER